MTAVVAMAKNRIIGDGKGLIWHIPDDLKRVKMLTVGRPLIMGRKTWDSIGRPLPGRASIVMTRDSEWTAKGAVSVSSIEAAISAAKAWIKNTTDARSEIILFGGEEIYRQGLDFCHKVERTVIDATPNGGVTAAYFPDLLIADWKVKVEAQIAPNAGNPAYRYESLTRRGVAKSLI